MRWAKADITFLSAEVPGGTRLGQEEGKAVFAAPFPDVT